MMRPLLAPNFLAPETNPCLRLLQQSLGLHYQVIEIRYGVCLSPQANLAGFFESVVRGFDLFLAVVVADDFFADALDLEFLPLSGSDLEIGPGKFHRVPFIPPRQR